MSERDRVVLPLGFVRGLLDTIEKPLIVAERSGTLLLVNTRASNSWNLTDTRQFK